MKQFHIAGAMTRRPSTAMGLLYQYQDPWLKRSRRYDIVTSRAFSGPMQSASTREII